MKLIPKERALAEQLKQCPFCDKRAFLRCEMENWHEGKTYIIGCLNDACYAYHNCAGYSDLEAAIKAWNTRA